MDWELKTTAWDFSVMGTEDDDPRLAALSNLGNNDGGDFSVDLQLGRLADMTEEDKRKGEKAPLDSSSSSGSSKRARAITHVPLNVTCIVDGCAADLSGCRDYHRRHRVCERHSKTSVVSVAGKEQRFCQQCSRFQSLVEFDEEKRSCRKRLDGHNRRRRKPQAEAFYMNHGSSSSNHQGARLLHFGGSETHTSPVLTWSSVPQYPSVAHPTFSNSSVMVHNGEDKRFPFLLVNEPERSNNHQLVPNLANNMNPHRVHSLLSSAPRPIQMGPSGLDFGFTGQQQQQQLTRSPALDPPQDITYHNSYITGNEMVTGLSLSPDDLLEKGASQGFPFAWK